MLKDKNQRFAIITMVGGTFLVLSFLFLVNEVLKKPLSAKDKTFTAVNAVKQKQKKKNFQAKRKVKRKKARKVAPPQVNTALPGSSFGLELFSPNLDGLNESVLGNMNDVAMTEDSVDELPKVIERGELVFPQSAKDKGLNGFVIVSLLINVRGGVDEAIVTEAQPKGLFEDLTLDAVKSWKFQPAKYKGKKVAVWAKQRVRFEVN